MKWILYKISMRLLSPCCIGWLETNNLQQTRSYVTGRAFWGALTARLVRDKKNNNYPQIGKQVDQELRFTYFFPSTRPDEVEIWPWGNSLDQFYWLYIGSHASTALRNNVAEQGMLHETEYIAPKTRDGQQVYLLGYVIEKEGCELAWKSSINRIQLGGERNYGWGRVEMIGLPEKTDTCFGYKFKGNVNDPVVEIRKSEPVFAHIQADDQNMERVLEPLIGRETLLNKSIGGAVSPATVCWSPGSITKKEQSFAIQEKGIWKTL